MFLLKLKSLNINTDIAELVNERLNESYQILRSQIDGKLISD